MARRRARTQKVWDRSGNLIVSRDFLDHGRQLLAAVLNDAHVYTIAFYRDETDSFTLNILPSGGKTKSISPSLISALLPTGSEWKVAKGWRSFSCVPLNLGAESFVCLGIEGVITHPERGAFPEYYGFIVNRTSKVATFLNQIADEICRGKHIPIPSYGVVMSASTSPVEHELMEASLIQKTSERYSSGANTVLKTAILSEAEFWQLRNLPRSSRNGPFRDKYLVAVIPSLLAHFSFKAKTWLRFNRGE